MCSVVGVCISEHKELPHGFHTCLCGSFIYKYACSKQPCDNKIELHTGTQSGVLPIIHVGDEFGVWAFKTRLESVSNVQHVREVQPES